jgi:hypothetical protein
MSEQDPLAALSAAAAKKQTAPKIAAKPVPNAIPAPRIPASVIPAPATPRPTIPRRKKRNAKIPILVPLLIGFALLAIAVPATMLITYYVMSKRKAPSFAATAPAIRHPPGELFAKVPEEGAASKPAAPAPDAENPPPDPR